jgi:hypothetical protein
MAEPAARPRKFRSFPTGDFGSNRHTVSVETDRVPLQAPNRPSLPSQELDAPVVQNAIRSSLQGSRDAISFWLFALQQRLRESATCRGLSRTMRSSAIARARR